MNAVLVASGDAVDQFAPGGMHDVMVSDSSAEVLKRFFVSDGERTVGPVDATLLWRGLRAGKVPPEALVWTDGWDRWYTVREFAEQNGFGASGAEPSIFHAFEQLSSLRLPSPDSERQRLLQAKDLNEAATIFFALCVKATRAECGWVHVRFREAGGAMTTIEGIGPRAIFGCGRSIDPGDQALRVAREGRSVLGEPIPGVVGSAVVARVLATGTAPTSVLMIPVLCAGQLLVMVELGVASRPSGFSARDAALAEQIARELSAIARKRAWHR